MTHLFAHDLQARLQVVIARRCVQKIPLLLDRRKLRVALVRDQMEQGVADALIRDLQHRFPFRAARVIPEFDNIGRHRAKLHFKLVVVKSRRVETDIFLPLVEIVGPVIERCYLHHYFPSNLATRFSLYALKPSAASALMNACASSSRSNARPSHWLP